MNGLKQQLAAIQIQLAADQERQRRSSSEVTGVQERLEVAKKEASQWEARRDSARVDFQGADADATAARKLLQEASARQGELVRDAARLESVIEGLRKEKDALEKEIGRLEAQRQQQPPAVK